MYTYNVKDPVGQHRVELDFTQKSGLVALNSRWNSGELAIPFDVGEYLANTIQYNYTLYIYAKGGNIACRPDGI